MLSNNPKIFLAPVSSIDFRNNYQKTVVDGIKKDDFLSYENSSHYVPILKDFQEIRLWGIKNKKLTSFNKTSINDIVLFYYQGYIVGKANIYFKDKNQNLSFKIWGFDYDIYRAEKTYWENIIFLQDFKLVKIDYKILSNYASFSPLASVRSFHEYSKVGTAALLKEHQSIANFLLSYQ